MSHPEFNDAPTTVKSVGLPGEAVRPVLLLVLAVAVAGCAAPGAETEDPSPSASSEPAGGSRIVVSESTAQTAAAAGAPCVGGLRPCSRGPIAPADLSVEEAGASEGIVTAWWNATTPAGARVRLEIFADGESVAVGEGTSPLEVDLPPEALARTGELIVFAEPAVGSVAVEQEVHLVLVLTYPPAP